MSAFAKIMINTIAALILTFGFIELLNVSDTVAGWVNTLSDTTAWVAFRTLLHVDGAENEENLVFVIYVCASLILSVAIVFVANVLVGNARSSERHGPAGWR